MFRQDFDASRAEITREIWQERMRKDMIKIESGGKEALHSAHKLFECVPANSTFK